MAPTLPALLNKARRCPGATLRRDGEGALRERKEKMSSREQYAPGAASGAEVRKDGEKWTLVLVRDLPHNPENVRRRSRTPSISANGLRSILTGTSVPLAPQSSRPGGADAACIRDPGEAG